MKLLKLAGVCLLTASFLLACSKDNSSDSNNNTENYVPKAPVKQNRSSKRGVSFQYGFVEDIDALGKSMSWSYNWGVSYNPNFDVAIDDNDLDFCPMAWNDIDVDKLRSFVEAHSKTKYLLAFNEPNLTDQANMTPQQAAAKWGAVKSIADELDLKLISPAMNYGTLANYSDPIKWLDEFFTLVPLDDVDGISVHCYMPNAGSVKSYIERFKKYGKPIWLTEFCAWDGLNENNYKPEGQQKHLSDVFNYLESDPDVFRYAWFIPRAGNVDAFPYMSLLTRSSNGDLTELGKIFTQISSQDKSTYYVEEQVVEAEHYSSISIADGVDAGWVAGPRVKTTTDAPFDTLELYDFLPKQWVEYQFNIDRDKDFLLELRYACFVDADLDILIDGELATSFKLENTAEDFIWGNAKIPLNLTSGKHTIRIYLKKGKFNLNWLKLK